MTLILETGSGNHNSNSYIDETLVEEFATSSFKEKWEELSTDNQVDLMIVASLFINDSFEWAGKQKTLEQGLAFPRVGISYQGFDIPDDVVPRQVVRACVMALGLLLEKGESVFRSTGEAEVKKEKLAVMETEYFSRMIDENATAFDDINNILRGFYSQMQKGGVISAQVLRA